MKTIKCENCDTDNRIKTHQSNQIPKCSNCGKSLLEPVVGKSGYIYILSNPESRDGRIKIGKSKDPDTRKDGLDRETASPNLSNLNALHLQKNMIR